MILSTASASLVRRMFVNRLGIPAPFSFNRIFGQHFRALEVNDVSTTLFVRTCPQICFLLLLETYWLPVQVASVTGGFLCYIDFPGTQIVTKQTLALEHVS